MANIIQQIEQSRMTRKVPAARGMKVRARRAEGMSQSDFGEGVMGRGSRRVQTRLSKLSRLWLGIEEAGNGVVPGRKGGRAK